MKQSFRQVFKQLQTAAFVFNEKQISQKEELLNSMSKLSWKTAEDLHAYQEILLFLAAHPESITIKKHTTAEFERIALYFKNKQQDAAYQDLGFPFTTLTTRFSHDLTLWLSTFKECSITIDSFEEDAQDLNTLLKLSLPSLERDETSAGLDNNSLMDALKVKPSQRLDFILDQFAQFNLNPLTKDHLWESLKMWVNIRGQKRTFSRAFNCLPVKSVFYQTEILKKFDHVALLKKPLPAPKKLPMQAREHMAAVIKKSLLLTHRETDPATFIDLNTLRFYELERGISIALYGMHALRQLPLQSYIGYTLFKNGYPTAYGGSWIFGQCAMFGLNIFEAFRGGESGYLMCQLLRVYIQVFQLTHVEVEPYQYGLDNPDGIRSGAFWFYYRYGFRPVMPALKQLAAVEQKKISSKPGYRSNENTLLRFTESNIALSLETSKQVRMNEISRMITRLIAKKYHGIRSAALADCRFKFLKRIGHHQPFNIEEENVLDDMALLCAALKIHNKEKLALMTEMIHFKPKDPYRYNDLLRLLLT